MIAAGLACAEILVADGSGENSAVAAAAEKEGVLVGAAAVVIAATQFSKATAKGAGWAGKVPLQGCAVGGAACRVSDRVSALLYLNGYTAQCRFLGGAWSGVVAGAGWRGMARGALVTEVAGAGAPAVTATVVLVEKSLTGTADPRPGNGEAAKPLPARPQSPEAA